MENLMKNRRKKIPNYIHFYLWKPEYKYWLWFSFQMCNPSTLNPGCRICVIKMKDKGSLVYHMTKTHHQLDMPYRCDKCGYRVSEYELLHNHFNKVRWILKASVPIRYRSCKIPELSLSCSTRFYVKPSDMNYLRLEMWKTWRVER